MQLTFQRQVLLGISFSILLVLVVGYVSYNAILLQQENTGWVDHTREVMRVSTSVKNRLLTAEANVRGFAITGNRAFEANYLQASNDMWKDVETLQKLEGAVTGNCKATDVRLGGQQPVLNGS